MYEGANADHLVQTIRHATNNICSNKVHTLLRFHFSSATDFRLQNDIDQSIYRWAGVCWPAIQTHVPWLDITDLQDAQVEYVVHVFCHGHWWICEILKQIVVLLAAISVSHVPLTCARPVCIWCHQIDLSSKSIVIGCRVPSEMQTARCNGSSPARRSIFAVNIASNYQEVAVRAASPRVFAKFIIESRWCAWPLFVRYAYNGEVMRYTLACSLKVFLF